ncbi:MAG: transporter substrate-binding domain-containing protein [Coriobacteriales bacterium]|nr:transporter substrate-binding domain-containing protein [Coriobacteriales bacterium]
MLASRRLVAMGMALLCAASLAGCSGAPLSFLGVQTTSVEDALAQQQSTRLVANPAGLKQAGTLTVGVRASEAAPLLIKADGTLKGLDVELGCALADEMGCKVAFVSVGGVNDALASTCDVVMGVSNQEATNAAIVGSYASSAIALFHKGAAGVVSADQMTGKAVAVQEGSASQQALRSAGIAVTEVVTASLNEAFEDLESGTVAYVVCPAASGFYLSCRYNDIACAGVFNEPTSLGIALSSTESEATAAIRGAYDRIAANGVLNETSRRWLGETVSLTADWRIPGALPVA